MCFKARNNNSNKHRRTHAHTTQTHTTDMHTHTPHRHTHTTDTHTDTHKLFYPPVEWKRCEPASARLWEVSHAQRARLCLFTGNFHSAHWMNELDQVFAVSFKSSYLPTHLFSFRVCLLCVCPRKLLIFTSPSHFMVKTRHLSLLKQPDPRNTVTHMLHTANTSSTVSTGAPCSRPKDTTEQADQRRLRKLVSIIHTDMKTFQGSASSEH